MFPKKGLYRGGLETDYSRYLCYLNTLTFESLSLKAIKLFSKKISLPVDIDTIITPSECQPLAGLVMVWCLPEWPHTEDSEFSWRRNWGTEGGSDGVPVSEHQTGAWPTLSQWSVVSREAWCDLKRDTKSGWELTFDNIVSYSYCR